jgi:hypothetical protein
MRCSDYLVADAPMLRVRVTRVRPLSNTASFGLGLPAPDQERHSGGSRKLRSQKRSVPYKLANTPQKDSWTCGIVAVAA